jgi:hypothetical protein
MDALNLSCIKGGGEGGRGGGGSGRGGGEIVHKSNIFLT